MHSSLAERFWAKVDKDGPVPARRPELGPCWIWTGAADKSGYGRIQRGARGEGLLLVTHAAWLLAFGRLPQPCALHHCDNPPCVKALPDAFGPAHLFEGDRAINNRDRAAKGRSWQASLTHCIAGHPFDEANTYLTPKGHRQCRVCNLAEGRKGRAQRRLLRK
jgi:hypothetical protein